MSFVRIISVCVIFALSGCDVTLYSGSDGRQAAVAAGTPTLETIGSVQPATVQELRRNAMRAAPFMVNCTSEKDRAQARASLTRAQILDAVTTADANELPSGCTATRPPRGTVPVVVDRTLSENDQRVWLVDMYYPSNPNRPWFFIVGDITIIDNNYFGRRF